MIEGGTGSMCLRGFYLMSGGAWTPRMLEAIVLALNGHVGKAIGRLFGPRERFIVAAEFQRPALLK